MKSKKEVKAVIFDVGGVLRAHLVGGDKESGVHDYIAKKLGIFSDTWFDSIDSAYADSITGKVSREKFLEIVCKNLKVSKKRLVNVVRKAYKKKLKKNKKLFKLAFSLKKKGYIIGILSDQWALSTENLIPKKDQKGFDVVIISTEVGVRKHSPKIYKLLLKKLKHKNKSIKPEDVLFIDNRDYNVKAAKKLGIKTILFRDNKQFFRDFSKLKI